MKILDRVWILNFFETTVIVYYLNKLFSTSTFNHFYPHQETSGYDELIGREGSPVQLEQGRRGSRHGTHWSGNGGVQKNAEEQRRPHVRAVLKMNILNFLLIVLLFFCLLKCSFLIIDKALTLNKLLKLCLVSIFFVLYYKHLLGLLLFHNNYVLHYNSF